jgi:chromosome segregation ATPase
VKANSIWMMALWVAGLGVGSAILGCRKEETQAAEASAQKAAADKAATDKVATDKAATDKAAADKAAADKAAADKAAADKAAADKAAADKAAALAKAESASLPPDLVEMKSQVTRMTAQVDLTMAKLEKLCTASGDLEAPSDDAIRAIDSLAAEIEALKSRGDQMRDRGAAYFEEWEKQLASISTPEVAAVATKRKDELAASYAEVLSAMQESRAALDAFWSDMKAIRTAVDEGVSPESQKLLTPQVKTAKDKGATLKSRVEATLQKVNQVSLIYTTH